MKRERIHSRPLSREEYTLKALEGAFPSGEWVTESPDSEGIGSQGHPGNPQHYASRRDMCLKGNASPGTRAPDQPSGRPGDLTLTIIGGTKYDEDELLDFLSKFSDETMFFVGDGRGVESFLYGKDSDYGCPMQKIEPNPDVYGKSARKVNVEQVLSYAPTSPLLLVGSGERVKQAEAWLKRANWPREVHRIG